MTSAAQPEGTPPGQQQVKRATSQRDVAASMALILDAMKNPIDPAYAEASKRREQRGDLRPASRTPLLVISITLIGVLIGVAAAALRVPAKVANDQRQGIITQIEHTQQQNDRTSGRMEALRRDIDAAQKRAAARTNQHALQKRLETAQQAAGVAPVSGHGVQLVLDNPAGSHDTGADSDPRTGNTSQAISSTDLQQIVNGLYQAGATNIAINGQRITSLSAIRFAGSAILVNYRPLATPYTVSALGPSSLKSEFDGGEGGAYVAALKNSGFVVKSQDKGSLSLPAVASVRLSYASPIQ